jgi:hypothetical protein
MLAIAKRLIARLNHVESVNVQSDHLAKELCAFMSVVTPAHIVKTFNCADAELLWMKVS